MSSTLNRVILAIFKNKLQNACISDSNTVIFTSQLKQIINSHLNLKTW